MRERGNGGFTISTAVEEADSAASKLCKGEPRQQQSRRGKLLRRDARSEGTALSTIQKGGRRRLRQLCYKRWRRHTSATSTLIEGEALG